MGKPENGRIMVVEGDKFMRIIVEKLCSPIYHVITVEDGESALELLGELSAEELPWVIISNQVMPNMKGTDFLRQSQDLSPESVKILLTAEEQTKDILKSMQEANAFLFQPKPFKNLPLLQSVKVSMDKFKSRRTISKLNHAYNNLNQQQDQYKAKLNEYKRLLEANKEKSKTTSGALSSLGVDIGFFKYISYLSTQSEKWYFTPHTREVVSLATHLAQQLELNKEQINTVMLGAMLHSSYNISMPPRLQVVQPFLHSDEALLKEFKSRYYAVYEQLSNIGEIGKVASMIYEKYDGSGFPQSLGGMQFPITGQIISISNLYHDLVYKIKNSDVVELKEKQQFQQTYEETNTRHNDAIAFLFRNVKWFDLDLLNMFKDCARRGTVKALQPVKTTLTLTFDSADHLVVGKVLNSKEKHSLAQQEGNNQDSSDGEKNRDAEKKQVKVKKIADLQPGDVLNDDIQSEKGSTIVEKGTKLTEELLTRISKLAESGTVGLITSIISDKKADVFGDDSLDDGSLDSFGSDDDEEDMWGMEDIPVS